MDPIILFFVFGLIAGLLRTDLKIPVAVHEFVSIMLLLSIGLKGGVELSQQPFGALVPQILAMLGMGFLLPLIAYPVLRHAGRFSRADAASVAAHYGSVSVGTYAVAAAYFASRQISFEAHMPVLLVVLEVPAIVVGILLARGFSTSIRSRAIAREVFLGKGIVLMVGGLLIGWVSGPQGTAAITPLFFDLFKGILALFLLEMGLITASQFGSLRAHGTFLVFFGIGMPLFASLVGIGMGCILDLSVGGVAMIATLAASASYIAVPAALRISVPEANPTLSFAAALGITFPFNVIVGIPLYHSLALRAHHFLTG